MHTFEMRDAIQRGNLKTAKRHAEHVLNLIEGSSSARYGDRDKDGRVEDPGNGTGLLEYLRTASNAAGGGQLRGMAASVNLICMRIADGAAVVLTAKDGASLQTLGNDLLAQANGTAGPAIATLEHKAKELGVRVPPTASKAGPDIAGQGDTMTVVVDTYQYVEKAITAKRDTTVIWVNKEQPKHTVTADDDSFKSGDMLLNSTLSLTFNDAGDFPYFCRFHGDKGGADMAGRVIVQ